MSFALFLILTAALLTATVLALVRRSERRRLQSVLSEIHEAKSDGTHAARLQYPSIDLDQCIGCGICVSACPENGVLDIVHGQAVVVHGARCVGHGRCADECPVGAIAVTLGDVSERRDLPAIDANNEAVGRPGVFLAGELTGFALVRTAVAHGRRVADEVAARIHADGRAWPTEAVFDLCIVGAGPAGISCALRATELGLRFVVLEKDRLGGAVAHYPRGKMVMTQPVELPLYGKLKRSTYQKEELIELWQQLAETHELPIDCGVEFRELRDHPDGGYVVETDSGPYAARHVCLALGMRGIPRKLGVPGEEGTKVAYGLIDAQSHRDERLVVVGGGDSAVEAAVGLSRQPGNLVHLSYRRGSFTRIKSRNERMLQQAVQTGRLSVLFNSSVTRIDPQSVEVAVGADGECARLENDRVFVMAGGIPPFDQLQRSGISYDPADRVDPTPQAERGTGLLTSLACALSVTLLVGAWVLWHSSYYLSPAADKATATLHPVLRPAGIVGVSLGISACALMAINLFYLVRRSRWGSWLPGTLRGWMTSHLMTGILAFALVLVHSGFELRATTGGRALLALTVVVAAGAVGRYLYSFVPRAANGRELELDEVRRQLADHAGEWDRSGAFGARVRTEVQGLIDEHRWAVSLPRRLFALLSAQRRLRRALASIRTAARREQLAPDQIERLLALARRAHRAALLARHYEDLRGLLASWRYLHRWLALLMVLMAVIHIVVAFRYAEMPWQVGGQ